MGSFHHIKCISLCFKLIKFFCICFIFIGSFLQYFLKITYLFYKMKSNIMILMTNNCFFCSLSDISSMSIWNDILSIFDNVLNFKYVYTYYTSWWIQRRRLWIKRLLPCFKRISSVKLLEIHIKKKQTKKKIISAVFE